MNVYAARKVLSDAVWLARKSPDKHTQNGAIITQRDGYLLPHGSGFNRFPTGVQPIWPRTERPDKYAWTEHAERIAIYEAARTGMALQGKSLVSPWAACADCARAIIEAGIVEVVTMPRGEFVNESGRWNDSMAVGDEMLAEAGVAVQFVPGPLGPVKVRVNRLEVWVRPRGRA